MKRTGLLVIPLITLLLGAAFAAKAQDKPGEVARIGILSPGSPSAVSPLHHQLREGLRDHGYVDGQNIVIEYRWAEGKYDRLSGLATELVRLKVDLIVAEGTPATLAAKQATTTIPIVIMGSGDPIGSRLVTNLARPGGNITGVSLLSPELDGKRLELLKELVPKLARLAVLRNPDNPVHASHMKEVEGAARKLQVRIQLFEVRRTNDFDGAFSAMGREHADALLVLGDPLAYIHAAELANLALAHRIPAISPFAHFAYVGGLMAYGASFSEAYRRTAAYVDKILKGAKPADLPIEQPTKFELVINLKTAKALGLTIPRSVLLRADEVIR